MSLFDVLQVARGAMQAAQAGIAVTANNTANAATAGYSRQTADLASAGTTHYGGLLVGQGVTVADVLSAFDLYTEARLRDERSSLACADVLASAYGTLEAVFSQGLDHSLDTLIQGLFDAFSSLSSAPDDAAYRIEVLSQAHDLAAAFSDAAAALEEQRDLADAEIIGEAAEVTDLAAGIADLNGRIAALEAGGASANDLRDERNRLLTDLAEHVGIEVTEEKDGTVTVMLEGQALVQGTAARELRAETDPTTGFSRLYLQSPGGIPTDVTDDLRSGSLGGLLAVRDDRVPALLDDLDRIAYDLVTEVNAVHSAGYGLDGVTGRNLFEPLAGVEGAALSVRLSSDVEDDPDAIAAAADPGGLPGDGAVAAQLAGLGSEPIIDGGASPIDAWASFIAALGAEAASVYADQEQRQQMADELQGLRDSASGVSLEEEAVNLIQFQDAYQAAAKVMSTAQEMLDTLLQV